MAAMNVTDKTNSMLCRAFFKTAMPLELVLIGCGTVGSELLTQVQKQRTRLEKLGVAIRVSALANSSKMYIEKEGIHLGTAEFAEKTACKAWLDAKGCLTNFEKLLALGRELKNPVLIDCTAGEAVPDRYKDFISNGFHIVTPNKRACAGPYSRYSAIKDMARKCRRRFLYETTVAAGLPVIENLQNLLYAGDELYSFSGILSGSLSYIFGRMDEGASFSAAVKEAMAKGFTEPDPREDLSGADVARKVLILAREAGMVMEAQDLELQSLLPEEYMALSKEDFLARMHELDQAMHKQLKTAQAKNKTLRFVGSIDNGQGKIGIEAVSLDKPLAAVKGGENALSFFTKYYSPIPLFLRGYGAGATVTAAGIFADIMRTLNWLREV